MWDHGGGQGPLSPVWDAASALDPGVAGRVAGWRARGEGQLEALFEAAGLVDVDGDAVSVSVEHPTFEEWWEPFTLGVGPAGAYVAGLDHEHQVELREQCRAGFPAPPFVLTARAWTAIGRAA